MSWKPVTPTGPVSGEPVALAVAKTHCRVLHNDDDAVLTAFAAAARDYVEGYTGLMLAERTLVLRAGSWADLDRLPVAPVSAIESITYTDAEGALQTLDEAAYALGGEFFAPAVEQADHQPWPFAQFGRPITVTCKAGGNAPEAVRQAMLLLIGHWYENREAVTAGALVDAPHAVDALLANYRKFI